MPLVTKAQWGGRLATGRTSFAKKLGIGVHWEGPKMNIERHDECVDAVRRIQNDHMAGRNSDKRPWVDGAYNLIPCEHGYVFEMRGTGNRSAANGGTEANANYLAICYLGGKGDEIPPLGWAALKEAIDIAVSSGFPRRLFPHSHFRSTECPGDLIRSKLPELENPLATRPSNLSEASAMIRNPAVAIELTPSGAGYWILAADGAVFAYGDAKFLGGRGGAQAENAPFVDMRRTHTGGGYYLIGADGGVFAYGDATFLGSPANEPLVAPIVSFSLTESGNGYTMLGEDGGVFAYGDAQYVGNPRAELD